MQAPPTRDGPRVNEEIRSPQIRLIDQDDVAAFCYINSNWETMPMFQGQYCENISVYLPQRNQY